jgi:hypothetical protein
VSSSRVLVPLYLICTEGPDLGRQMGRKRGGMHGVSPLLDVPPPSESPTPKLATVLKNHKAPRFVIHAIWRPRVRCMTAKSIQAGAQPSQARPKLGAPGCVGSVVFSSSDPGHPSKTRRQAQPVVGCPPWCCRSAVPRGFRKPGRPDINLGLAPSTIKKSSPTPLHHLSAAPTALISKGG